MRWGFFVNFWSQDVAASGNKNNDSAWEVFRKLIMHWYHTDVFVFTSMLGYDNIENSMQRLCLCILLKRSTLSINKCVYVEAVHLPLSVLSRRNVRSFVKMCIMSRRFACQRAFCLDRMHIEAKLRCKNTTFWKHDIFKTLGFYSADGAPFAFCRSRMLWYNWNFLPGRMRGPPLVTCNWLPALAGGMRNPPLKQA